MALKIHLALFLELLSFPKIGSDHQLVQQLQDEPQIVAQDFKAHFENRRISYALVYADGDQDVIDEERCRPVSGYKKIIRTLAGVKTIIRRAINVGAPLYNQGDIGGCRDTYVQTANFLLLESENCGRRFV